MTPPRFVVFAITVRRDETTRISIFHDSHRGKFGQDDLVNGDRQRQMILEALGSAGNGLDTNQLAEQLDLHPNTIRWHLGRLTDAGLVQATPNGRHGRGRPSIVHRLTGEGRAHGRDEYRLLATMLTDVVASDGNGETSTYEAGVRWGRHLRHAEPDASLADLLDQEGFAAEQHGGEIEMRRCPFYALAEASKQVICTLHQGIIDGALEEAGSDQMVEQLDPFVEPGLCIARLGRRRPTKPPAPPVR
jgi:predicted ArsR family transcriptional regulator